MEIEDSEPDQDSTEVGASVPRRELRSQLEVKNYKESPMRLPSKKKKITRNLSKRGMVTSKSAA